MKTSWILLNFCTHVMTVTIYPPDHFVLVPGGNAAFSCLSTSSDVIDVVQWLINGTVLESLELTDVEIEFRDIGHGVFDLELGNIPIEFNTSWIQCRVDLRSGRVETSSRTVLILLEGLLGHVQSLKATELGSTISIVWTPPEQLNSDGINNNLISYCIEIVILTSSETLLDQCGLIVTEFDYPFPATARCQALSLRVTITPVNPVGSGRSSALFYDSPESSPGVIKVVRGRTTEGIIYSLLTSAPLCDVELTLIDSSDIGSTNITLGGSDLGIGVNSVTVMANQLSPSRDYNVICDSSNARGSNTSMTTLHNHDLNNFVAMESTNNSVTFELSFFEVSDAMGALLSFLFMDNGDADFSRSVLLPCNTSTFHNVTLHPGSYLVHGYDIGHNGTLYPGISNPVVRSTLQVNGSIDGQHLCPTSIDCNIGSFSGNITAKCSSSSSMVVGLQVLVQVSKADEVSRLHVNDGDLQSTVTVKVDNGTYRVTVFPVRSESGILHSCPYTSTVSVFTEDTITEDTVEPGTDHIQIFLPVIVLVIAMLIALVIIIIIILKFKLLKLYKHHEVNSASDVLQESQNNIINKGSKEEQVMDGCSTPTQLSNEETHSAIIYVCRHGERGAQPSQHAKVVYERPSCVFHEPPRMSEGLNHRTPSKPSLQRNIELSKIKRIYSQSEGEQEFLSFSSPVQPPDEDILVEVAEMTETTEECGEVQEEQEHGNM